MNIMIIILLWSKSVHLRYSFKFNAIWFDIWTQELAFTHFQVWLKCLNRFLKFIIDWITNVKLIFLPEMTSSRFLGHQKSSCRHSVTLGKTHKHLFSSKEGTREGDISLHLVKSIFINRQLVIWHKPLWIKTGSVFK